MKTLVVTERTRIHRHPERGSHERAVIHSILDEALVAHVGFMAEATEGDSGGGGGGGGQPFVMPMAYARMGEQLLLHGSRASRALARAAAGAPLCVTVTLVDGLVLARSAFSHSMNYRSVVILGRARELTDEGEKRAAMDALVNHVLPGRAAVARPPTARELGATRVLSLSLAEASAKVRSGGPKDDQEDLGHLCWAGHLPLALVAVGAAVPDPQGASAEVATPPELLQYRRAG